MPFQSYAVDMSEIEHAYIPRPLYMDRIKRHIGSPLVKVLTGQRRVGKSYMIYQIADIIRKENPDVRIVEINIPRDRFELPLRNSEELYRYITSQFSQKATSKVVMIDEIQEIPGFEETIAALVEQGSYDVYITGSNRHLLSGDLATLLSGRYTQIEIHSLSYLEFLEFHGLEDSETSVGLYMRIGGLPYLHRITHDQELIQDYFRTVEETILLNDIIAAHKGSNKTLFRYLIRFLADSIGSPVSAASISRYLKSQNMNISVPTVVSFLETLERSYLLHRSSFYDLKGKQYLDISSKYYFEDTGIRNYLSRGLTVADRAKVLEQVVYQSLLQRGYRIHTGRTAKDKEIDFIAHKGDETIYVQVCEEFSSQEKIDREFGNLLIPRDAYRRFMITQDTTLDGIVQDGIKVLSLRSWLRYS